MNETLSKSKLKWQGEEVKVEIVYVKVYKNEEKPLWWYNYEVEMDQEPRDYTLIEACKITHPNGETFYISNHHGIGIRKLRKGGWPNHQHFSLPSNEVDSPRVHLKNTSYCQKDFIRHEAERRAWQKKNFPEEFKASERLRKLIKPRP